MCDFNLWIKIHIYLQNENEFCQIEILLNFGNFGKIFICECVWIHINIPNRYVPLSWHFQLQFSLDSCTNEFFNTTFCYTMKVHNWLFFTILLFQNMDCNGFTISIPYSSALTQITANFIIRSFSYAVLLATLEKRKIANNRRYARPKYHVDRRQ